MKRSLIGFADIIFLFFTLLQMAAFYNEVENLLMNCKKEVVEEDRLSKDWAATEEKKKTCTKWYEF